MRKLALILLVVSSVGFSGCLKTRAELREEQANTPSTESGGGSQSQSTPAQVKDVEPQGGYAIDEIKGELTRLNGRIEDLERTNKDNAAQGNAVTKDDLKKLEGRITELEQAQANMLEAIKKMQETQVANADPLEAFEAGKKSFDSQNFDAAIEQLSTYLKSPKGKHVEEATYLRGESYFQIKQYKKAIVDFSKFTEQYTRSKLVPQALLRIGQSFDALGMKEDAAGFYQELVEKYPKSPEAKKARKKIK